MEISAELYFVRQAGIERGTMSALEVRRLILKNGTDHFLVRQANSDDWQEPKALREFEDLFAPTGHGGNTTKRETPHAKR